MWMWKQAGIGFIALSLAICACSGFTESLEDSKRASAAVKAELGIDSQISVRTVNGHTSVAVRLATPPTGDAAAAKRQITDIIGRTFRAKVEHVDLAF
jgi:hypothetical protein